MGNRAGKRVGTRICTHTHTVYRQTVFMCPQRRQKNAAPFSFPFSPHWNNVPWLLGDMLSVVSQAGEFLFYIRLRPWGSKQRPPVFMHSSSPLISCVVDRVSLIPPDSCHSPSQCTTVDSDTHRLPHQNTAAVESTLSHPRADRLSDIHNAIHSKQQSCFYFCFLWILSILFILETRSEWWAVYYSRTEKFNLFTESCKYRCWPGVWKTIP